MKLNEWLRQMEEIAPAELAVSYDNPGLLISPASDEIKKVLVVLDCTTRTAEEAEKLGADLVLSHHPLFFHGTKHLLRTDPATAAAYELTRRGIGLFSMHTNYDAAAGGVNDVLASRLGLTEVEPLPPDGLGRIGNLPGTRTLRGFAAFCENELSATALCAGKPDRKLRRIAVVGGAGGDYAAAAAEAGADALLTGECRHHEALEAEELGIALLVLGHYETEHPAMEAVIPRLQAFENDVQYIELCSEQSPLRRL